MPIVPRSARARRGLRRRLVRELYALADRAAEAKDDLLWVNQADTERAIRSLAVIIDNSRGITSPSKEADVYLIEAGAVREGDALRVDDLVVIVEATRTEDGLVRIDFTNWDFALIAEARRPLEVVAPATLAVEVTDHVFFPRSQISRVG